MEKLILEKYYSCSNKLNGLYWYQEANQFARDLSDRYNLPLKTVCGVISALSPGTNWNQNKKDTENLIRFRSRAVVTTYGQNKKKALRILKGSNISAELNKRTGSFKTWNFYQNILNPGNPLFVTIDRHILAVLDLEQKDIWTYPRYLKVRKSFVIAAKKLNLLACELQAILWCNYKDELSSKLINEAGF